MKRHHFAKQSNRGFTLVEILVAAFIFGTVIATAVGIFALSSNVQVSTEIARNAVQSERFNIEQLSRDIRMAEEGFEFCNSENNCTLRAVETSVSMLKIKFAGNITKYYWLDKSAGRLMVKNEAGSWESIFPDEFKISSDDGYGIFKGWYPSGGVNQRQPYVTIRLKIDNIDTAFKSSEQVDQTIETTVTSRAYGQVGIWKK